jgi:hypothetical protein
MVKKSSIIKTALALIPLILAVFACSLPSNIEIMGSPELSFSANKSLTDMFEDMIGLPEMPPDSDIKPEIFPCKNVEYQTYIVRIELFNDEMNINLNMPGSVLNGESFTSVPGGKIKMNNDVEILDNTVPSISFGGGLNKYFEGFEFTGVNSTIFISGSEVINSIRLEIDFNNEKTYIVYPENKPSGYEEWNGEYSGETMPEGRITFDISPLIMSGEILDIKFKAFLEKNKEIDPAWLEPKITVELIVWYPLVFTATNDDAKIDFPDNFFGDGESDLFGRTEPNQDDKMSPTEIIQSAELKIKLSHNLFNGAKLNIASKDILISTDEIEGQYLGFKIDEENMKKINEPDNFPFNPKFSFNFKKGGRVNVPWELSTEEFSLKARIHHTISLKGEDK